MFSRWCVMSCCDATRYGDIWRFPQIKKVISGGTHPVLLQFKQLPQPLQEDRLRDLKMVKTLILSTFKMFAVSPFSILNPQSAVSKLVSYITINFTITTTSPSGLQNNIT